jgi:hypothetical protein
MSKLEELKKVYQKHLNDEWKQNKIEFDRRDRERKKYKQEYNIMLDSAIQETINNININDDAYKGSIEVNIKNKDCGLMEQYTRNHEIFDGYNIKYGDIGWNPKRCWMKINWNEPQNN